MINKTDELIENVNEFVITANENNNDNENDINNIVESLMNSDLSFDINEIYEKISSLENDKKNLKLEPEYIIKQLEPIYLECENIEKVNKSFKIIKEFLKKYNTEKDEVKKFSSNELTKLFAIISFLIKNNAEILNNLRFNISITREEFKFINSALLKVTYNGTESLNMMELLSKTLKEWKEVEKTLPKNIDTMILSIDIKSSILLSHFLNKHTVHMGSVPVFSSVVKKLIDINELFNAYNIVRERIISEFKLWSTAIDELKNNQTSSGDDDNKENLSPSNDEQKEKSDTQ